MQVRSRGVAAITALLFVACGVLAMRHEASTAHVLDRAGGFVHARTMTGHHAGRNSDIHGQRNPEADAGDCALLTVFHQSASPAIAAPAVVAVVRMHRAPDAPRAATTTAVTDVYRLAPKTSPPVAV
jgi:hypothetical protein